MCSEKSRIFEMIKWITPVILFFLGLYFNKLSERMKENRRLKKVEEYFVGQLSFLDKQLTEETNELNKCFEKINNWESNDIILNQTSNMISERLLDISQQDLFSIFIYRKKGDITENTKCYNSTISHIDYISKILPHLLETNKKVNNELNGSYDNWNIILLSITKLHNSSISDKQTTSPFLKEMHQILEEFEQNYKETTNIKKTYDYQIQPLKELCKKYSHIAKAQELMDLCERARNEFNQIISTRENHAQFIILNKKEIEKVQKELRKDLNEFKNIKTKKNYVA